MLLKLNKKSLSDLGVPSAVRSLKDTVETILYNISVCDFFFLSKSVYIGTELRNSRGIGHRQEPVVYKTMVKRGTIQYTFLLCFMVQ